MARLGRRYPVKPHYNTVRDTYGSVIATKLTTSAAPLGFSFRLSYNTFNNCIYGGTYGNTVAANIYKVDATTGTLTTHGSLAYVQSCSTNQNTGIVYYGRDISTSQQINTSNTVSQFSAQTANGANGITYNHPRNLVFENAYWANLVYIFNTAGTLVTSVSITRPTTHVVDSDGIVFISASTSSAIYKVDLSNVASLAYSPGGNIGTMVFDSAGNMFALDITNNLVKKITPGGTITTFATMLPGITDMTIDSSDNLYVTNSVHHIITQITPAGLSSVYVAGPTGIGFIVYSKTNNRIYFTTSASNDIYYAATPIPPPPVSKAKRTYSVSAFRRSNFF